MKDFDKIYTFPENRNIKYRQYLYNINIIGPFLPCMCNCLETEKVHTKIIDSFWGAFATLRKSTISFVMPLCLSVLPHVADRLPLEEFTLNLMFGDFSKMS
jgi:hypothetical protein